MTSFILALDQGTTSSRAIVFSPDGVIVAQAQQEFPQLLPEPAVVQHDPEDIWSSQLSVAQQALQQAQLHGSQIGAIGITNQRETTILWERASGKPVAHAVVWQSRVSAPICAQLKADGWEPLFRERTGLVLDPYFSGTKIRYLLDSQPGLQQRADRGEILFGTVDSFLIWRLTGGRYHVTDPSNASRTLLFDLHRREWDDELLQVLGIPRRMLPEVVPSSGVIGECDPQWFGHAVPISGCAGDQQAATFGQTCFHRGNAKNTYGTGCFLLMNAGDQPVMSGHQLLTTVGWQIDEDVVYCLEGAVFIAGAVVQWLRDGLGIIRKSQDVEALAASVPDSGGVLFVPAFVGLGAPHWDPRARGTILGITRGTTAGHFARAALEAIAFQTCDLVDALRQDAGCELTSLQVDGGASVNNGLMQLQADLLGVPLRRPRIAETTALGAAFLAGRAVGLWPDLQDLTQIWSLDREFQPRISADERESRIRRWRAAVQRSREWADT
jgi:glycerol kinase